MRTRRSIYKLHKLQFYLILYIYDIGKLKFYLNILYIYNILRYFYDTVIETANTRTRTHPFCKATQIKTYFIYIAEKP